MGLHYKEKSKRWVIGRSFPAYVPAEKVSRLKSGILADCRSYSHAASHAIDE